MQLSKLIEGYDCKIISNIQNIEIKNICYDSRKIIKKSLFVCIKGENFNGHDFIEKAIELNAVAVVVQEDEQCSKLSELGIGVVVVSNTRNALAYFSAHFYDFPSTHLKLIGITGSKGKTAVAEKIYSLLREKNYQIGMIGSKGSYINDDLLSIEKNTVTTPNSLELQKILNEMCDRKVQYVIMEATSHSLVLNRVDYCEFEVGVITNIYKEHMDYHGTMENYISAKLNLFKQCKTAIVHRQTGLEDVIRGMEIPVFVCGSAQLQESYEIDNLLTAQKVVEVMEDMGK